MTATTNSTNATARKVSFDSAGATLVGNLFTPAGRSGPHPAVVVTGTWTSIKEQMADRYARALADRGFLALSFDFTGFGESDGLPRDTESPARKARDICSAVTYLAAFPDADVGRLGALGVCAGAGYAVAEAVDDPRVSALALVAPWLHDSGIVDATYGGPEAVAAKIQASDRARERYARDGTVDYVPMVSGDDPDAAIPFDVDFYLNPARGALPQYPNRFAVMAWRDWLTFDPIALAPRLEQPTLLVHSRDGAVPDGVRAFDAAMTAAHRTVWLTGEQFDFYDGIEHVAQSADLAAEHFRSAWA